MKCIIPAGGVGSTPSLSQPLTLNQYRKNISLLSKHLKSTEVEVILDWPDTRFEPVSVDEI